MMRLFAICAWLFAGSAFAWSVDEGRIINSQGEPVELRGASWYGAEVGDRLVPSGLYLRGYKKVISEIKALGFNAVRLPFCPRTLSAPPVPDDYFWVNKKLNPGLYGPQGQGLTPFEIYQRVAAELDREGFYILADHHLINCPDTKPPLVDITPLWTTPDYSEADWIASLEKVTAAIKPLPGYIGMDLNNEPHGATWSQGRPATDWDAAATRAARRLLKIAPNRLVFVQGIAGNANCGGGDYPWWFTDWGGNLSRQHCAPISIRSDRLVLSPHVYGPIEGEQGNNGPHFFTTDARDPESNPGRPEDIARAMPEVWDQWFGRLAEDANYGIAIGEFNSRYGRFLHENDPITGIKNTDTQAEKQRKKAAVRDNMRRDVPWAEALIGYLTEKGITDSFWWAINGDGPAGGIYYGKRLPDPEGRVRSDDQWHRIRRDIVNNDPNEPGLLNRYWNKAACHDGLDNDQDGLIDAEDSACEEARLD